MPTTAKKPSAPEAASTPDAEAASVAASTDKIHFAHPSERECARILDFYRIRWEYEPRTFPIEWDKKGRVIASFAPDFYLPDLDLYIELTTMSQKLVTKKNRKIRRLRELYPDVNVKIFYQKDFRNLLLKYGLHRSQEPLASTGEGA